VRATSGGLRASVISRRTPKLVGTAALVALLLLTGLVGGLPLCVVLAGPFALLLVLGIPARSEDLPTPSGEVADHRVLVGQETEMTLRLDLALEATGRRRIDVGLLLPPGLSSSRSLSYAFLDDSPREQRSFVITADRYGRYELGRVALRRIDPSGLFLTEALASFPLALEVHPKPETLRTLVRQELVRAEVGDQVGRSRAEGIEFADVRPYVASDRVSRINWRVTARSGALYVNTQHPERSTDVVLFVDTFVPETLETSVRVAVNLARTYLGRHDRVGLVSFGGVLSFVEAGTGPRQLEQVIEALVATDSFSSFAWKEASSIPVRLLPRGALILGVTSLIDERALTALATLRGWGYALEVIAIPAREGAEEIPLSPVAEAAALLFDLERRLRIELLVRHGVAVAEWSPATGTEGALRVLAASHRHRRSSSSW